MTSLREVDAFGARMVEITGGEPMLQREVTVLMQTLLDAGHEVLLETGGHIPLDEVPEAVVAIVDVKCPGSGESAKMHWPNLEQLSPHDEVKFVIADRVDFEYACEVVEALRPHRARGGRPVLARARRACTRRAGALDPGRADPGAFAAAATQVHLESRDTGSVGN